MRFDRWSVGTLAVAALVAMPIAAVAALALLPDDHAIWAHLVSTVLPGYVRTTIVLMLGVGLGTLVIGTGTAWLVTMCRFPGSRLFEWALLLPLAVPTYVVAYIFTDVLEYAGPVQGLLRDLFGWTSGRDYWFPEIRSVGGAIAVMTVALYPYVYLLARAAFLDQSVCVLEVSRTLGRGPWRAFWSVALPLARPALVAGVSLVLMEALNDFGTVDFFAVRTFTAGIYDVWLNMNSTSGAAQLACLLLAFVLVLIGAERWARRGQKFHHATARYRALSPARLGGWAAAGAVAACALPVALGFLLPAGVLLKYAVVFHAETFTPRFWSHALNSLGLAGGSAIVAAAAGLFLAYGLRLSNTPLVRGAVRVAGIGYAVPGAVLAVGVMIPLARFDNAIDALARDWLGVSTGLLLSGTVVALGYGYLVRFLALANGTAEAGLARITPGMDGAARTLGMTPGRVLHRVHLPMMRGSLLTAVLLVFVDGMKELPMTVILRPFNFETLATFVHQYASDELLEECAAGALAIVAFGLLPVIGLSASIRRSRPGHGGAA
ncbi:MAG: iron ABC transporter permease [Rhodobacterales bacterium]|nr:iron ABC transporter permease [Rhodobacterales bacterium]